MTSLLHCARHAPVALEQHCYGRLDVPPGEDARLSASRLCLTLMAPAPVAIWTSPLQRCREVAAHLARLTGAALRIDDRLAEIDFGEWEGCSWKQIERRHPSSYRAWLAAWPEVAAPSGEPLSGFETRVRSWLGERAARGEIQSSALVGHAGVIRALRVLGAGATWKDALSRSVPYLEWLAVPVAGGPYR
jgi:broad specificity phosphatase PhoE